MDSIRSVPAPVGGWNARDALAQMKPTDAIRLTNWYPRPTYLENRGGASDWLTGLGASGKSLMNWNGPASSKFFVGTSAGIYEATTSGAAGGVAAACTNGKFQWVQFAVASGTERLIAVNGADSMFQYDGTTWNVITGVSAPVAITGVTTSSIINVNIFKQRLFLIQSQRLSFWYLPVQSLGGLAVEFFLNTLCPRGGFLMAMATWTFDAGNGPDDYAVFITSEGEAVVFQGSDPGDVTAWSLVGVFFVGRPIGRRCFTKLGGDVILLVEEGAFPLSQALLTASIDKQKALTNRIELAFQQQARLFNTVFGWQAIVYKAQGAVIVNIPNQEDGLHYQYVMNTTTQRWTQFAGWNAECFGTFNGDLYFCTGTKVAKAWTTNADFGANIVLDAKPAFNYFGTDASKLLQQVRPIFMLTGPINFLVGCDVDFNDSQPSGVATYTVGAAALWDVGVWDVDLWSSDFILQKDWKTVPAVPGFAFALLLRVATSAVGIQWPSTDFVFEPGSGSVA